MNAEKIALFDMDGTLCDYEGSIRRCLMSLAAPGEDEPQPFGDNPDYIENRIRLIRQRPGWWRELDMLANGYMILRKAVEIGFQIHILTKGPSGNSAAWAEKVEWCREHLKDIDYNITITEDKGLVYGTVLVDDYPPYAERWLKWRPRGLVIMPVYSYNWDLDHPNVVHYDGSHEASKEMSERLQEAYNR